MSFTSDCGLGLPVFNKKHGQVVELQRSICFLQSKWKSLIISPIVTHTRKWVKELKISAGVQKCAFIMLVFF